EKFDEVDENSLEVLNCTLEIEADEIKIKPNSVDVPSPFASFNQLNYNLLLSIYENRKKVDIEFECDSLSDNEWIEFRRKMLSREISLTSLDILIPEFTTNSLLFDLHGIEYSREMNGMEFISKEEGKKILYNENMDDNSFSIILFDGLFITEFRIFIGDENLDEARFGLRLKWCENEEEMKKSKENYKIVTAIKK
ncbi:hypothetical protein PFISCL1PPCAC_19216, partial [Pristionchus fissidentatus]